MTAFDPDGYSVEMVQGRRGKKEQGRVRHRGRNYWAFPKPSMATDRLPGTGSAPHMHGKAPLVIATKRFTGRYQRWRRESKHSDKWKLCDTNPGLRPEKAG